MERLTTRDFRALFSFLQGSYAHLDLNAFVGHVLRALPNVIRSEPTSFHKMMPTVAKSQDWGEPPEFVTPTTAATWEQVMHEHPVIAYYLQTGDGQAMKLSDFLTRGQLHRLALYNEHYRAMDVESAIGIHLPSRGSLASPPLVIAIALHRRASDFSERERLLLNLLRPHLVQGYHNAVAVTQLQHALAQVTQALEELQQGVIILGQDNRVERATAQARQWLAAYFGRPTSPASRLPEGLEGWVRHQQGLLGREETVPPPRKPLVVEGEGKRLVVRLVSDVDQSLLLLQEEQTALQPTALEPLGLSRRETEVLTWIARGKTNAEIALILGMRPRTVDKHCERIYQKLGVENRMAAARYVRVFTSHQES